MPHLDAAYNLGRWLAGNDHDAEDIAQEACVRAFRFVGGCRGSDGRAWLLAIVRSLHSLLLWKFLAFGGTAFAVLAILFPPARNSERDRLLGEAVAGHVRSLMDEHLTDVASSDQHTVKPWFNGKLDFAPEVKDFAAQGFPLVGGRLDYFNGRAVAALVYRRNKHFINVFVWPVQNTGNGTSDLQKHRGYSVINRDADGLRYCVVFDLNEKELAEFANLFGR